MGADGKVLYTDPDTGEKHLLDPVQLRNYEGLREQGLHHEDAVVVAYLMDSTDPAQRTIDWVKMFLRSEDVAKVMDVSRTWVTMVSRMADRPEWQPTFLRIRGDRALIRLWSMGRARWLKDGTPAS